MNETYYDRDCLVWSELAIDGFFECQAQDHIFTRVIMAHADLEETRGPLFTSVAAWDSWNYGGGV